ncbi:MAG: exodeoxyribonuclease VII small subunit [Pirellulaceae bacterium]|jgi:exodeoxyribonuclease VII small subunit|nr:exodeoxyribonuclease VII small subunit [Pirellulaceae bacterium]
MAKEKSDAAEKLTFEEALEGLEGVVQQLEQGQLDLTESLAQYQIGVSLLKQCHDTLKQAERRIEVLTGVDADGNAVTEPFADEVTTLEKKQSS